jgi:hypothetical protein
VKANMEPHANDYFSETYIFSSILVTGFYTYPEHTPTRESERYQSYNSLISLIIDRLCETLRTFVRFDPMFSIRHTYQWPFSPRCSSSRCVAVTIMVIYKQLAPLS